MTTIEVKEITDSRTFRVGAFTIQVLPQNRQVSVTCVDWKEMNGQHSWWHHGCPTLWHFIAQMETDPHYAMNKLFCGQELMEIDEEATRKALLAYLKEHTLDAEQVEEVQEYLERAYDVEGFGSTPYLDTPYEHLVYQEKFCCLEFRKMWPVFCAYVKNTILPTLASEVRAP